MTTTRVFKYPIPIDDRWHDAPAQYGHVGMQDGVVMLWAVDPDPWSGRWDKMRVVGTGHDWDARNRYIGSVQDPRGFVWHVIAGGHE